MVGTLAQLIALVSYGNAYLKADREPKNFYPENSTFQFCNSVVFVDVKKFFRVTETEVAADPLRWLSWLKEGNCRGLYLTYTPTPDPQLTDHIAVAFVGGGGTWQVAAVFSKSVHYWLCRWEVTESETSDNKIWKVTYGRVAAKKPVSELFSKELSPYKKKFESALQQIVVFADRQGLGGFAKSFRDGLDALSSSEPMSRCYHRDLLPDTGFGLEAKQLIGASCAAWVFGGMGSWSDLSFDGEDQNEYERLSKELYAVINSSVEKSVNSFG